MHCSDEELLAHLDGELSPLRDIGVWLHLKSCWRCRTRMNASEEQIHRLSVSMDEWPFPPPEWACAARRRLLASLAAHEAAQAAAPRRRRIFIPIAAAAAASLALAGIWQFGLHRPNRPIQPAEVIAHVAGVETATYSQPVHQSFSVQIVQTRPAVRKVDSHLQIWCDRASGRFASRVSGSAGELRHGLWRSAGSREYVYRGSANRVVERQQHRVTSASLTLLGENGLDPDQIQSAFLNWLETRSWNPIALSSDLSVWAAEDGTVAAAERLKSADGASMIRITARRKTRTLIAVLSLEVDSDSYQPRLETIRFETADRTVEFRLAADSIQKVSRAELNPAVFRPDPSLEREPMGIPERAAIANAPAAPSARMRPRLDPVDMHELQARYALHQAGACLGEAVRVSEGPDGPLVVRIGDAMGYAAGERMDIVLRALDDLRRDQPSLPASSLGVALRHAWALKQLSVFFASWQAPERGDPGWRLLAEMVRDHRAAVGHQIPSLGVQPSEPAYRREIGDWHDSAGKLFSSLMQWNNVVDHDRPRDHRLLAEIYKDLDALESAFPDEAK